MKRKRAVNTGTQIPTTPSLPAKAVSADMQVHPSSPGDFQSRRMQVELAKLETEQKKVAAELDGLLRPFYRRSAFWIPMLTTFVALVGLLVQLKTSSGKMDRIMGEAAKAEAAKIAAEYKLEIATNNLQLTEIKQAETSNKLFETEKELNDANKTLATVQISIQEAKSRESLGAARRDLDTASQTVGEFTHFSLQDGWWVFRGQPIAEIREVADTSTQPAENH